MDTTARRPAVDRLEAFVGEWTLETSLPPAPGGGDGRAVFEWMLDRRFLIERATTAGAPESVAIIGVDPAAAYTQHYFDDRGVARTYAMEFAEGVWILRREAPDFTPLEFLQRYTGTFSSDGASIVGRWETSADGSDWVHDFDLTYTRVPRGEGA